MTNKSETPWEEIPKLEKQISELQAKCAAMEAVVEAAKVWRTHHVCCPKDCPDLKGAEKNLGDALDALAALAAIEAKKNTEGA